MKLNLLSKFILWLRKIFHIRPEEPPIKIISESEPVEITQPLMGKPSETLSPEGKTTEVTFPPDGDQTENLTPKLPRPPIKRGGTSRTPIEQPKIKQTAETKTYSLKPEIVCWEEEWRRSWIIGVEVPEEMKSVSMVQNGEQLECDTIHENCYRLKYAEGEVKFTWAEGEKDIPFIEPETHYLIFKMRNDWKGPGRSVKYSSTGYYLLIVPKEWNRNEEISGPAPIEPETVQFDGYKAHFFYKERDTNTIIGFITGDGTRIHVELGRTLFQLVGGEIDDASEKLGPLFGGQPPHIRTLGGQGWSNVGVIVVGEEGRGRNRWRTQFVPKVDTEEQVMPDEITNRRGGWYFVRIYDKNNDLLESTDFRFMNALKGINKIAPTCLPKPDGHDKAIIKFLHYANCRVESKDTSYLLEIQKENGCSIMTVPPIPDCDQTHWILCDGDAKVEVTLLVERIWWALGSLGVLPTNWTDKPITLSHKDFTAITDKALWVRLPRPRWAKNIEVGFDRTKCRSYEVEVEKKEIAIPLRDFCDAKEIQNPKQDCSFQLFIDTQDKPDSATLLQICISFRCKNCEFITHFEQEALSHIPVHLSDFVRHLSYTELSRRYRGTLPHEIYKCSHCDFYVLSDTSAIIKHLISKHHHESREFRKVTDVDEIRENYNAHLPHIYRCQMCVKEFKGDDKETMLNHLQEKHVSEFFEVL